MSTLSTNQIVVEYIIKEGDIKKAQQNFDKLTESEKRAIVETKNLNAEIKSVGTTSEKAFTTALTPIKNSSDSVRTFTANLKVAAQAAVEAGNKATAGFSGITAAEKKAEAAAKAFNEKLGQLGSTFKTTGSQGKKATDDVSGGLGKVGGVVGKIGPLMATAFSIGAIVSFGKQVFDITGKFETMGAVLKNTLGSESAALGAMTRIQEIASKTPFSVEELTASFVKLANQGFQPTNQEIIKLGDLASSTGKSFDQLAEALIDAQVGEFERLKEFGIRASKQGDQVKFTFKGVETTVRNTNDAIRNYVTSLGDAVGVSGAMAKQSETLDGQISNLGDNWDGFLVAIGTRLAPVYEAAIQVTSSFLGKLKVLFQNEEQVLKEYEGQQYNAYANLFTKTSDQALQNQVENSSRKLEVLKKETETLKAEYDKQRLELAKAQARGQDEKGSGFARQFQIQADAAKVAYDQSAKIEKATKAANQAAIDEIKKRSEAQKLADAQKEKDDKANAEKMAKINKQEYDDRLKQIELEKQITAEKIKQTVSADGQNIAMMELEFATNVKLQKVSKEYADKNVKQAKDQAKLLPEIIKTQNKEIEDAYFESGKNQSLQAVEDRIKTDTIIYEAKIKAVEKEKRLQDFSIQETVTKDNEKQESLILNEIIANNEKIKINEDAANRGVEAAKNANDKIEESNKELYAQLAALRKKDAEDRKATDVEITQASARLASQLLDGFMNLQSQRNQIELTAIGKRYDEEIRLAGDNKQKVAELNEKRLAEEREIRIKEFKAQQAAAVAQVLFNVAPIIAKQISGVVTAPLAAISYAAAAAQIGFILAQPVPEFAEGTKGKPFKGGKAIVGEIGKEWVVTTSGQVYETPSVATLVDLPKGSQVIPNKDVVKAERFMGSKMMNQSRGDSGNGHIVSELISIKETLAKLPITSLTMDERGFTKKIQTKSRETTILNNRFSS
jgi:hypothetical protein